MELDRAESNLSELMSRLKLDNDQLPILQEMKCLISALPPSALQNLTPSLSVENLFDSLNTSNKEQIELACDLLSKIFRTLPEEAVLHSYQTEISRALGHPDNSVKLTVVKQLQRCTVNNFDFVDSGRGIFVTVFRLIGDDNMGVANESAKWVTSVLTGYAATNDLVVILCSDWFQAEIQQLANKNDTVRFRIYEVISNLCVYSPASLEACISANLIQPLINEFLKTDDILAQLNSLELLTVLTMKEHGLSYLELNGSVSKLEHLLLKCDKDPLISGLLMAGLIRFFGHVAHFRPAKILDHYRSFMDVVIDKIDGGGNCDMTTRGVSIDTIGIISQTIEGKQSLNNLGTPFNKCVANLGKLVMNAMSELRVKSLDAISTLIFLAENEQTEDMLVITENWWNLVRSGDKAMLEVLSICKQPFADLHISALALVKSLAFLPWGQRRLSETPGFVEYLLDRATETTKEGKEAKFSVVEVLVQSRTTRGVFNAPTLIQLREYYNEGPFYVRSQAEVAVEGE